MQNQILHQFNMYGELAERSKAAVLKAGGNWSVYLWDLYCGHFDKSLIYRHISAIQMSNVKFE